MAISDNTILDRGLEILVERLPPTWRIVRVRRQPRAGRTRPDAVVDIRASDGSKAVVVLEAKSRLTAQDVSALAAQLSAFTGASKAGGGLLIIPFATPLARERLRAAGISYIDLTGNARIVLERPALFIETQGADRDPAPLERRPRSLKGAKAARLVRALCDWQSPLGVRELARRANVDPGYTTRVLKLLEEEDIVARAYRGEVAAVKWQDLLRRWSRDYQVSKTNRAVPLLSPRGIPAFLDRLRVFKQRYALTGSFAVPAAASVAPGRVVSCYFDAPERVAAKLDLRSVEAGANVLLLDPFDGVVFERTRRTEELQQVAMSQCAVDLMTGTGREPAEADALLDWMARNEDAWRA